MEQRDEVVIQTKLLSQYMRRSCYPKETVNLIKIVTDSNTEHTINHLLYQAVCETPDWIIFLLRRRGEGSSNIQVYLPQELKIGYKSMTFYREPNF